VSTREYHTSIMNEESINQRLGRIEKILLRLSESQGLINGNKEMLSIDELSEYTGLTKGYLYKLTSGSVIPFYKPNGKRIYFKRAEVDLWLLQNRNATNDEIENQAATILTCKKRGQ